MPFANTNGCCRKVGRDSVLWMPTVKSIFFMFPWGEIQCQAKEVKALSSEPQSTHLKVFEITFLSSRQTVSGDAPAQLPLCCGSTVIGDAL